MSATDPRNPEFLALRRKMRGLGALDPLTMSLPCDDGPEGVEHEAPPEAVVTAVADLLHALGIDLDAGTMETPERVARFFTAFLDPEPFNLTVFEGEGYDQMVVQRRIPFYSLCEHHLLPFFGTATVAYLPGAHIVGLSKLARVVRHYARRLQNQERITQRVAALLHERLQPRGVAVVLRARHLCMEMRGVEATGAETVTSCLLGAFRDDARLRAEFMAASGLADPGLASR